MVMGPTCGMILAQLGAEVIKVEPPAGDKTRSLGGNGNFVLPAVQPRQSAASCSISPSPKTARRCTGCWRAPTCFLENFRDGQLEKQGLGADELRRRYPHLIVAGHKGFLSGPYEHRPALDEVVQMMFGGSPP